MECKCRRHGCTHHRSLRINRYIMECKFPVFLLQYFFSPELIDTLWNVNGTDKFTLSMPTLELIDTLWNVNFLILLMILAQIRINRYIMECK